MIEIQEYLQRPKIKDLPQEVIDEIIKVRTTYEYMPYDMFIYLKNQKIVRRTAKLKNKRSLFVCPEGKIWYFNSFNSRFDYCGYFYSEEETQEIRLKKEQFEKEVIDNRKAKAAAKKLKHEEKIAAEKELREKRLKLKKEISKRTQSKVISPEVKPKRKRIRISRN